MGNAGAAAGRSMTTLSRPLLMKQQRRFAFRRPPGPLPDGYDPNATKVTVPLRPRRAADPISADIADVLAAHRIDVEKVRRRYPAALRYDVPRLLEMLKFLSTNHLDTAKIINRQPQILQMNPQVLASKLAFFQTLSTKPNKVVESCPQLLFSPTKTIQRKMDMFRQRGVPPELLLNRFPSIFALGDEAIQHRIAFLQHLGLDAKQIAKRGPPVYALSEKNIQLKFDYFSNLGFDAARIFNAQPGLDRIPAHSEWRSKRVPIYPWTQPQVIGRSIDHTLPPTIEFLTKDMGRSLEEISRNPVCLTCSLTKRIKPRHRYMMAHGRRKDFALGTLLNSSEESFVWNVARQPLEHYRDWLKTGIPHCE